MRIEEVKRNAGKMVEYKGVKYKFTACIMRWNEAGFFYQAELFDTRSGRSVIICKLEDVRAAE